MTQLAMRAPLHMSVVAMVMFHAFMAMVVSHALVFLFVMTWWWTAYKTIHDAEHGSSNASSVVMVTIVIMIMRRMREAEEHTFASIRKSTSLRIVANSAAPFLAGALNSTLSFDAFINLIASSKSCRSTRSENRERA